MTQLLFLSRRDVEALLEPIPLLEALREGFRAYSSGSTSIPPRTAARSAGGMLGAMPGWVDGAGLVLKAVSVFPDNHGTDLPSHQALISLFDDVHGSPLAVMDGGHITAMRTGGGAAVSVGALAREGARTLAIMGAGVQGRSHLATVPLVRDFERILVASRTREHAQELASLDSRCEVADTFEEAVRGADVVCCCTDAREPIIRADWLRPGTHVTSVGGTFGPELDAATMRLGRVFVEWRGAAENAPPAGAHELQGLDPADITEVGEILAGTRPGRQSEDEITIYKSTGIAFEDAIAARLVYAAAVAAGAGTALEL